MGNWSSYDEMQLRGIDGDQIRFNYMSFILSLTSSMFDDLYLVSSSKPRFCCLRLFPYTIQLIHAAPIGKFPTISIFSA